MVDLVLLRELAAVTGSPTSDELRSAAVALFQARAEEGAELGLPPRDWPPTVTAHSHWASDYARAAASAGVDLSLDDAVAGVNAWIAELGAA